MNKPELIDKLTLSLNRLPREIVALSFDAIIEKMTTALEENRRIEIRGFGVFSVVTRKSRIGRNPMSGDSVSVPERRTVHMKPGKAMRERVNGGAYEKAPFSKTI